MKELIGWGKHWELGSANEPNAEQVWREKSGWEGAQEHSANRQQKSRKQNKTRHNCQGTLLIFLSMQTTHMQMPITSLIHAHLYKST